MNLGSPAIFRNGITFREAQSIFWGYKSIITAIKSLFWIDDNSEFGLTTYFRTEDISEQHLFVLQEIIAIIQKIADAYAKSLLSAKEGFDFVNSLIPTTIGWWSLKYCLNDYEY